jgi:hypothetical protein
MNWVSEQGSSVSIVSGCGLDDRAIEVRSPAEAKGFFPLASVSRPALGPTQPPVQWVPGVLSPGLKRGRSVTPTTHPHLVPKSRISRSYTSSLPSAFMACSGTTLASLWKLKLTGYKKNVRSTGPASVSRHPRGEVGAVQVLILQGDYSFGYLA